MRQENHERASAVGARVRAAWRVRACAAAMAVGAQVFLLGAGVVTPLCLNAAWIAALAAIPAAGLTAALCRRALACGAGRPSRMLHALLAVSFVLCAVFAMASLVSLGEHSLLPQTRATHSLLMTVLAAAACALSGAAGTARLAFALRFALPLGLAALCAASLSGGGMDGLFPILGAGAERLGLGALCMLGAAFPVLMLLTAPPEIGQAGVRAAGCPIPGAWFFAWRAALGAGAGALLLFALCAGSTYESIAAQQAWGGRLLIRSHSQPAAGLPQTGLTLLQMIAVLLLAANMLLCGARSAAIALPALRGRAGLGVCVIAAGAALGLLLVQGFELALHGAPWLLAPLLLALAFHRRLGDAHGT